MNVIINPLGTSLGATVKNIDLSKPISLEVWKYIYEAFLKYSVLVFPKQTLSIEQYKNFAMRFGRLKIQEHLLPLTVKDHPECIILHNDKNHPPGLNYWHTDNSGWREPTSITLLYAKITPQLGGDTIFANMYQAFDSLSRPMQHYLMELCAEHDIKKAFGDEFVELQNNLRKSNIDIEKTFGGQLKNNHPIVITHPLTQRKSIYISYPYITRILDVSRLESQSILKFLYEHITTPEFSYRHWWNTDDVVVFDTLCTQHLAVADYFPYERLMYRLNICGKNFINKTSQ